MPELRDRQDEQDAQRDGVARLEDYMASPRFAEHLRKILPSHLDSHRFYTIALRCIETTPNLALCTAASVAGGILQAATLGLEIATMGESWLIPYETPRKSGNWIAQLQIGYLGHLSLAWRSTQIAGVQIDVVMPGDAFDFQKGTDGYIHHKPAPGRQIGPDLTHAYMVVKTIYGGYVWDVLSKPDIERIRNSGPSANSPAWLDWYPEQSMAKTAKRTLKFAPKSRELARAIALDDELDAGKAQSFHLDVPLALAPETPRTAAQKLGDDAAAATAARAAQEEATEPETAPETEREPEREPVPARKPTPEPAPKPTTGKLGW